jgi:acetyl-CoA carboxylase biotin carboxyl carrier protein
MEIREIKALLALMQEYGLAELEIDDKKRGKLRLVRAVPETVPHGPIAINPPHQTSKPTRHVSARVAQAGDGPNHPPIEQNQRLVTSPMVGTFYRASSPDAQPFVEEGDSVRKGQTLCIIEAMKMMNEIEAEMTGRIVRILCENAHAVEYGQPLMVVEIA